MAAPYISAIAAYMYSTSKRAYPINVKSAIIQSLDKSESLESYIKYPGIISLSKIIEISQYQNEEPTMAQIIHSKTSNELNQFFKPYVKGVVWIWNMHK
jgi:hypothetical protein